MINFIGVERDMYNLFTEKNTHINDEEFGEINIEFIPTDHYDKMPSFGFIMNINGEKFYYSGDSKALDERVIHSLENTEIKRVYQDTCSIDYEGNIHLSFNKLCSLIPHKFRKNVYCIHLDKNISEKDIVKEGFKLPKLYKGGE